MLWLLLNPNNQLLANRGVVSQISPDSELAENGLVARNFKRRERELDKIRKSLNTNNSTFSMVSISCSLVAGFPIY